MVCKILAQQSIKKTEYCSSYKGIVRNQINLSNSMLSSPSRTMGGKLSLARDCPVRPHSCLLELVIGTKMGDRVQQLFSLILSLLCIRINGEELGLRNADFWAPLSAILFQWSWV